MGVDLWNDTPTTIEGDAWKADTGAAAENEGAWQPEAAAAEDEAFTGEFGADNVSKHAGAPADGGCRNCGEDGHFARDCPNERVEREFTGECNECGEVGHRRADCPNRPAQTCKICGKEGHLQAECTANRLTHGIEALSVEDAWTKVEKVDGEKDVEDIKKAILAYAKAFPEVTFFELESTFRAGRLNTYLIAKEQVVSDTHVIVNLQGEPDQKYAVSIQFSNKPRRAALAPGWPANPEENLTRLAEAGFILDRMVPKCQRCGTMGHGSKQCSEEAQEPEKVVIKCDNCGVEGSHRLRDCPEPRKVRGGKTCRNCGSPDHIASACEEPPNIDNVECKHCSQMGHFAKDCPAKPVETCRNCGQEGHRKADCVNDRVMQCRNCDVWGHSGKECPVPRDMSRVECMNCKQKGHFQSKCPNPPAEVDEEAEGGDGGW